MYVLLAYFSCRDYVLIDEKLFRTFESDDELLIVPSIGVGNESWQDWNLRWLRSLHISKKDNSIISCGFPKFMNLNEGVGQYKITEQDIIGKVGTSLLATLKIDGSLLIRFVHDGKVRFRTRGSLGVFVDNADEINQFCKDYPALLNPDFYEDLSLLFEWVSPKNQIVIKYEKPELILIGAVTYDKSKAWYNTKPYLYRLDELDLISENLNITISYHYSLKNAKAVQDLIDRLQTEKAIEGFVLRFGDGDDTQLVKVKSQHYFILHTLKSNLTTKKLIDLWISWDKPSYVEYDKKFIATFDYECWKWAMPAISAMFDGVKKVERIIMNVRNFVAVNKDSTRKDFAILSQQRFNQIRLSLCFKFYDNKEPDDQIWSKLILQNCKQVEKDICDE